MICIHQLYHQALRDQIQAANSLAAAVADCDLPSANAAERQLAICTGAVLYLRPLYDKVEAERMAALAEVLA